MEADVLGLGAVQLFIVLEEEPVCECDIEELRLVAVKPHEVEPLSIAVSSSEQSFGQSVLPGVPAGLLYRDGCQANPVCGCVCM